MQLHGRGGAGDSWESNRGEFIGCVWVRCGGIAPLSHGVSAGMVYAPDIYIGLILWVWVKSALVVEKFFKRFVEITVHLHNLFF